MISPLLALALLAAEPSEASISVGAPPGYPARPATAARTEGPPAATAAAPAALPASEASASPERVEQVPGLDGAPVRVERRTLVKAKRLFLTGGGTWLARGDYYVSPGVAVNVGYYPLEQHGLEVNLALLVSFLSPGAEEVFARSGLVPDAQKPLALLGLGYRYTFGYGKAVVGPGLDGLVHFDVQAIARLGLTITDRAPNPTVAVGPALLVRFNKLFVLQLDVPVSLGFESRVRSSLAFGVQPALAFGVML